MPVCGELQRCRQQSATTANRALSVCECSALGMPWGTVSSSAASAVCRRMVGPALGAAAGLGRWLVGVAVLWSSGILQMRRQWPVTTAHRALPMCSWLVLLGMPWGTARWKAASSVRSRCGGDCTGCCGRAGQEVVYGGCGFVDFWSLPDMEAVVSDHGAQSPSSVCVASPGHAMGHCKLKCSL